MRFLLIALLAAPCLFPFFSSGNSSRYAEFAAMHNFNKPPQDEYKVVIPKHKYSFDHKRYSHSYHYYTNSAGRRVQSPTYYSSAPAGATALCRDGTYSFSQNHRGTCSHHGGVQKWLR